MSDVKKWHMPHGATISESQEGEFVLASDYAALEADRDRLKTIADNYCALLMDANAELAKLRAGQEPVAWRMWNGKTWRFCYSELHGKRGWEPLYALPPAQASAWVADDLRIAMQQRDHYAARVEALELGLLQIADDFYPDNDSEMALALGEMREAIRSLVTDAAPTPGASDGKGGDV